ncbi:MAG: glycosyltransferase family 4 protein [Albidovulum sp.]|uniref:glycosyltransferase family 4 protein n=1 Tax=Albidovulum sp. TaxID=1872424 RepID=UPI001DFB0BEE|nr:glycosyltransferase family 4 protein [uncultured Defluviimonas sp.]MCB2124936.1 glycosyltransferase family 4 protein [Paracoccaceae bacterium]
MSVTAPRQFVLPEKPKAPPSVRVHPARPIRALMSNPCETVGVGRTCRSILAASIAAGYRADLVTARFHGQMPPGLPVREGVPRVVRHFPFGRRIADGLLHRRYLDAVGEGDIAYLWPSVPVSVYERLARRGVTIVTESVNTRMAVAKPVLDAAYDALGLPPGHGITDLRIAIQNLRQVLCSAIFAPSPAAEHAFAGTPVASRVIPSSYGTSVPAVLPDRPARAPGAPVTFVFVGSVCVRKGAHLLLEAWRSPPPGARLRLVGEVEPAIRARFSDVLDADTVSAIGFSDDVAEELLRADIAVLPSLEEGDPISTYEAAAHGLPVIASVAGAGRIGAETGAVEIIDPHDIAAFRDRLSAYAADEDFRRDRGAVARAASLGYDWSRVGPDRFDKLFAFLGR